MKGQTEEEELSRTTRATSVALERTNPVGRMLAVRTASIHQVDVTLKDVVMEVLGRRKDLVILEVFSNLNDSVVL